MKILHLSTFDEEGGAARAASRLHRGLLASGTDSWMLVRKKVADRERVLVCGNEGSFNKATAMLRPYIDALPLKFYPNKRKSPWHVAWMPNKLVGSIDAIAPDIVHAHWLCSGFLSLRNLEQVPTKLVWTLHDSWPFTGGCHIINDCVSFRERCGQCPQLGSVYKNDLSSLGLYRKQHLYQKNQPIFVAPSRWMAEQARTSSLLADARIEIIPNGLDTSIFQPIDKQLARGLLNLPLDKKIIMFGAMSSTSDPNKGFEKLKKSLEVLKQSAIKDQIEIVIFGATEPKEKLDIGFRTTYLGRLHDDVSLAVAYSAADIICIPSIQESFGQVATEAMSCGTPVVAFATSGLLDIVDHNITGYLALPYDEVDFAKGIELLLGNQSRLITMSIAARNRVIKNFEISVVCSMHSNLYENLIYT